MRRLLKETESANSTSLLKQVSFHPLTLAFQKPHNALEQAYRKNCFTKSLKEYRLAIILGIVVYAIFVFRDMQLISQQLLFYVFVRLGILLLVLAILLMSYARWFYRLMQTVTALGVLLVGISIIVMVNAASETGNNYHYAGLILLTLYAYIFLQFRFIIVSPVVCSVFGLYLLVAGNMPDGVYINSIYFLVTANLMGMVAAYRIEKQNRRRFLLHLMLGNEHEEVYTSNQRLEEAMLDQNRRLKVANNELQREMAERQRIERSLEERKHLLDEIFHGIAEGISIIDKSGHILFYNRAYQTIFEREELSDLVFTDLFGAQDKAFIEGQLAQLREGMTVVYKLGIKTRSGSSKYLQITSLPRQDEAGEFIGSFVAILDVTQHKEDELELLTYRRDLEQMVENRTAELEASNSQLQQEINERFLTEIKYRRFKAISDNANYGNAIVDLLGRIIYINKFYAEIAGYDYQDLIKKNMSLFYSKRQMVHVRYVRSLLQEEGQISALEVWHTHRNGLAFPMLMNAISLNESNKKNPLIALSAIDISELKQVQAEVETQRKEVERQRNIAIKQRDEIKSRSKALEKAIKRINVQNLKLTMAYKEIKKTSQMKEVFLANTSHEIRTPLNAIIGLTNLLADTSVDDKQESYISNIKNSSQTLLAIINDILDFSKIEAGRLNLEMTEFDLVQTVKDTIETFRIKANSDQVDLSYEIDKQIPMILIGDPLRINQILINLVGNALKFTNSGGRVSIRLFLEKNKPNSVDLLLEIADTGIGIPKEKQEVLFDSFTQANANTTRLYGGTGLGLAIVKRLVDLHDGTIDLESEVDQGTTFKVRLSFEKGHVKPVEELQTYGNIELFDCHLSGMKILLVEDIPINQEVTRDTIKNWNQSIDIDFADNGQEAIERLQNETYHLILMDIQMPVMNGVEATDYIRNKLPEPQNHIPIIALTANAMEDERRKCIKIGMNDYISKPFVPEELFYKIKFYTCTDVGRQLERGEHPSIAEFRCKFESKQQESTETEAGRKSLVVDYPFAYIDLTLLNKIYKGNINNIHRIIKKYLNDVPLALSKLKGAYADQDWTGVKAYAHSLKSVLGYLGLKAEHEKAKLVENYAKKQVEWERIAGLIQDIEEIWLKAQAELQKMIK